MQARYRKDQTATQPVPWIPPVDNLLKDSTDGSALGALLHFYCPQLLQLDGEELTVSVECVLVWGKDWSCNIAQRGHDLSAFKRSVDHSAVSSS